MKTNSQYLRWHIGWTIVDALLLGLSVFGLHYFNDVRYCFPIVFFAWRTGYHSYQAARLQ